MNRRLTSASLLTAAVALAAAPFVVAQDHGHDHTPLEAPRASNTAKAAAAVTDKPAGAHECAMCSHPLAGITDAVAVVTPTQGNNVRGVVHFHQQPDGKVVINATIEGLPPNSRHGFHIHEFGDTTAPDATSAGSHYNPEGHDHGLPDEDGTRHAGDFGNLESNDQGVAAFKLTVDNLSLGGMSNPVLGRAVIIHAQPDDGGQPTGNAGDRIASGVIGIAKPAGN